MKRILPMFLSLGLLFAGCGKPTTIDVYSGNFTSVLNIKTDDSSYHYKFCFGGVGTCSFTSMEPQLPVDFIWEDNNCILKCNNIEYTPEYTLIENSNICIIKNIIETNLNKVCAADYNGIYAINGNSDYGDYRLELSDSGLPVRIELKSAGYEVVLQNTDV